MTTELKDHKFVKDWVKHQTRIFLNMYPEIDKAELKEYLHSVVKDHIRNPKAKLHNNHNHKEIDIDLLSLIDWFDNLKPIAGGFGVFFKNQNQAVNPAAVMLDKFMKMRKKYKGRLHDFEEGSYEYKTFDRYQLTEKTNTNAFYGCSGKVCPL